MRVALVHDYLKEYGGAERVLEAFHNLFPQAPVYTAFLDLRGLGPHAQRIKEWEIRTSWIQKLPLAGKLISPFRLLAAAAFESFDLGEFDLVISSCAIYFAKAVITKPSALHISYIHTPPRYLYGFATSFNYKKHWWTKAGGEMMNHFLRIWDYETSQRPDILVANSENVKERIRKFYRRDCVVIYPPVAFLGHPERGRSLDRVEGFKYYLSLGRLVRGKGTEIIVEACSELNLPLKVAGIGPEEKRLKNLAGKTVEFLGQVKDEDLPNLLRGAKAVIVASEDEDFGIVPVEAMACGTPVIAPRTGGFLETIIEGKTGVFYFPLTVESLIEALKNFDPQKFQAEDCQKQAEKFSEKEFGKKVKELIERNLQ